ncbi:30S ribosomal protein S20 [Butyricicoccus sp.]|uniref:30S ribosomal protein S20 n=1 Tax=Butyricicoccus sp. TaxID=2049021 RepID=UPI0037355A91
MPNIKSAKKRVKVTKVKDARNQAARSQLRTILKKFDAAVAGEDKAAAESAYKTAVKALDKAAASHLIHKNKAANKKSALTLKLNASK